MTLIDNATPPRADADYVGTMQPAAQRGEIQRRHDDGGVDENGAVPSRRALSHQRYFSLYYE